MQANAPESDKDSAEYDGCLKKIDALVKQYSERRKEIEDSFVACGLEVPLVSRNLNATVNPVGPSFEPVGRDYRTKLDEEAKSRDVPDAPSPATATATFEDSDDPEALELSLSRICSRISDTEAKIVKASIEDDFTARERLEREAAELRTARDKTILRIKSLKAAPSRMSDEQIGRIDRLEDEIRSLRVQISMLREEINELKDQMFEVTDKLGIDFESEEEDDDL